MTDTTIATIGPDKGPVDRKFTALFKGQKYRLYASYIAQARQRAVEHLKPKKRDKGLLQIIEGFT